MPMAVECVVSIIIHLFYLVLHSCLCHHALVKNVFSGFELVAHQKAPAMFGREGYSLASFSGPTQLFVASNTASNEKLGRAWVQG